MERAATPGRSSRAPARPLRLLVLGLVILPAAMVLLGRPQAPAQAVSGDLKGAGAPVHNEAPPPQPAPPDNRPPVPQTAPPPVPGSLAARLQDKGLKLGSPVTLRVFKEESRLELWVRENGRFTLFATYPICDWSGTLGPKLVEGDRQSPEGFYFITRQRLHRSGRWGHRSFNIGFPNILDRSLLRSGSYLLIHGGCKSTGCFAMTDPVMAEIHELVVKAIEGGQTYVPVHVFPFRMTEPNLARFASSQWYDFWLNLKEGHDSFERTHLPPHVSVCNGRYRILDARAADTDQPGPMTACEETAQILSSEARLRSIAQLAPALRNELPEDDRKLLTLLPLPIEKIAAQQAAAKLAVAKTRGPRSPRLAGATGSIRASSGVQCNPQLASCRRFLALKARRESSKRLATAPDSNGR